MSAVTPAHGAHHYILCYSAAGAWSVNHWDGRSTRYVDGWGQPGRSVRSQQIQVWCQDDAAAVARARSEAAAYSLVEG